MMEQLKAAASRPQALDGMGAGRPQGLDGLFPSPAARVQGLDGMEASSAVTAPADAMPASKVSFSDALKNQLEAVSNAQQSSEKMGERFSMGDDKVNLSDVMISMQKASISFQGTVQVRNKLVSAYHEIMNMQV